jgi:hypothetical protein
MLIKHINMYLVFPAFASTPASILVTNKLSMFKFIALCFAHITSWCVPLSFKPLRFARTFLMTYSTSKLKSNVDKASLVSDYSKKNVSDKCEIVSLSRKLTWLREESAIQQNWTVELGTDRRLEIILWSIFIDSYNELRTTVMSILTYDQQWVCWHDQQYWVNLSMTSSNMYTDVWSTGSSVLM